MGKNMSRHWRYPDYTGVRIYLVEHPAHEAIQVFAPSWQAAIWTAAKAWGEDWRELDFHMDCKTLYMGTKKEVDK